MDAVENVLGPVQDSEWPRSKGGESSGRHAATCVGERVCHNLQQFCLGFGRGQKQD